MSRVRYVSAGGKEPPLNELEKERLKGQQLANQISHTKLRRIREEVLEKREVAFVLETMLIVLRQELMRAPSMAIRDLRDLHLGQEVLFAVRQSVDKVVRSVLQAAADTAQKALSPKKVIAELTGVEEPSPKEVDAAQRRKARKNARRRVIRRVVKA